MMDAGSWIHRHASTPFAAYYLHQEDFFPFLSSPFYSLYRSIASTRRRFSRRKGLIWLPRTRDNKIVSIFAQRERERERERLFRAFRRITTLERDLFRVINRPVPFYFTRNKVCSLLCYPRNNSFIGYCQFFRNFSHSAETIHSSKFNISEIEN